MSEQVIGVAYVTLDKIRSVSLVKENGPFFKKYFLDKVTYMLTDVIANIDNTEDATANEYTYPVFIILSDVDLEKKAARISFSTNGYNMYVTEDIINEQIEKGKINNFLNNEIIKKIASLDVDEDNEIYQLVQYAKELDGKLATVQKFK